MGKMSKTKGAGYENKIAKELSDMWGGKFSRVPASGGLHWGSDQRVAGDIIPPLGMKFPFVVECKKREGFDLSHLFKNIGQIKDWFQQVVMDSRRLKVHGVSPLLIFSKNREISYILLPYSDEVYDKLNKHFPVSRQTVSFLDIREEENYFDTLLTTMDGFKSLDLTFLWETYHEFPWDIQNPQ
ncbi:holliday junction resolvase [Bacillus phage Troll]|uniref:Holliday junction resolvase n=3 Tax=Caudoviricetes TaxID=2731619 RepID=A0A143FHN8_9CAUD|nr:RusA-like Holliday junction resolvase [Bacillus phage Troll]AGT13408.1 holliday junction resolvase [Bacillus phage Troll]AMW61737.1 holliday junction resolvase [Bacillus phage Juglone]